MKEHAYDVGQTVVITKAILKKVDDCEPARAGLRNRIGECCVITRRYRGSISDRPKYTVRFGEESMSYNVEEYWLTPYVMPNVEELNAFLDEWG